MGRGRQQIICASCYRKQTLLSPRTRKTNILKNTNQKNLASVRKKPIAVDSVTKYSIVNVPKRRAEQSVPIHDEEHARRSVTTYRLAPGAYKKRFPAERGTQRTKARVLPKAVQKRSQRKNGKSVRKKQMKNQSRRLVKLRTPPTRSYSRAMYKAKVKRLNARMVKKDTGKPRGKMSAYAFFLQVYREELKQRNPNESVNFAEFSKKCAEKWKGMSEQQKKRFNDMATQDKSRHASEMQHYQPGPGEKGIKRKRGKKDPNAPKRALSAFFWFCNEERPNVKAALQNSNSVSVIAKELGRRWALVRPEQKSRYEALAAKDKERYEKEQKVFKAKAVGGAPANRVAVPAQGRTDVALQGGEEEDEEDDDEDDEEDEE